MSVGFRLGQEFPPYRLELWTEGGSVERELVLATEPRLARVAFREAAAMWPGREATLRQQTRVIASSLQPGRV